MALGKGRRTQARQEILEVCWQVAREHGLAGFTLRQVATAVGVQAPSLYTYFDSKYAMYDAMFAAGNAAFAEAMAAVPELDDPTEQLSAAALAYLEFCCADPVRHQLLFQRTLPGFEPSPGSYAAAGEAYEHLRTAFTRLGITDPQHIDLWTAVLTGLADQQLSNDPGGDRWTRLAGEAAAMFVAHIGGEGR